jgi:hypothetical protein
MTSRIALVGLILAVLVPCRAGDEVKVRESTRRILTGPFKLKGPAPQERLH